MDTRTKIVSVQDARRIAEAGATVVSGYFDPMLASGAERLLACRKPGTPLLVLVAEPPQPILPALARMHLVAGLAAVDHVSEIAEGLEPHFRMEEEDARRLADLIAHVHQRQSAGK